MLEPIKKAFKMGIYGKIQKITDWIEQKYNIENCWLNFKYDVRNFPDEFRNTCHYIGLKDDDTIFAANYKFGNGKVYSLVAISPPMDEKCKTSDYTVIFQRNYWQYPGKWYETFDETEYINKKKDKKAKIEDEVENIFVHLQNFCATIDMLTKQLKTMPVLQKANEDFIVTTEDV